MLLTFADTIQPEGAARDWFLVLDGVPLSAKVALFAASRIQNERAPVIAFRLYQNVPNPSARSTSIGFDLPVSSNIRLEIFDMQGRLVRSFADHRDAGRHVIDWDLRDSGGHVVAPGIYAYRFRAGKFETRLKMVVLP